MFKRREPLVVPQYGIGGIGHGVDADGNDRFAVVGGGMTLEVYDSHFNHVETVEQDEFGPTCLGIQTVTFDEATRH